ncbi:hypothetical protein [Comamonas testosteroni]|uniref:Uncharacterized protein n=1 Tax=Comamonas testosteroni TaxID=285 RepID=A0A096HGB7_COMTE|nr:hypothetical protein [Comamonas testosteroni]KGH27922.1 hypothetical protein P353_16810 [Comamonas testosteroni]
MAKNESLQFYLRLLNQKHSQLVSELNNLLRALSAENPDRKKVVAENMLQASKDLKATLSNSDVPDWLTNTIIYLGHFLQGAHSSFDLLSGIIKVKSQIESHRWKFEKDDESAFDFDSIFEHYKNESRLPDLFNQIVKILEEIEQSGEIDSVTMIKALGKLIATFKASKDGSYFAINSAWEFLMSFLKNYMWAELAKIPVLGTALEALEKTIKETNEEMFNLHQKVQASMSQAVESEVKALKDKAKFGFIGYNKNGNFQETTEPRLLPNISA